jgi:hypothetical protein
MEVTAATFWGAGEAWPTKTLEVLNKAGFGVAKEPTAPHTNHKYYYHHNHTAATTTITIIFSVPTLLSW